MYVNETVFQGRPKQRRSAVEEAIFDRLDELGISYLRVDHDHETIWTTAARWSRCSDPASAKTSCSATGRRRTITCS